jgi:hypothetical protein
MFEGDRLEVGRVVCRARALARELDHPRAGSEHLLLALTTGDSAEDRRIAAVLAGRGATATVIRHAVRSAAPLGAGVAFDRELVASVGVDLDRLLSSAGRSVDQPPAREPLLPLGAAKARRRWAQLDPPLGLDAQAVYEASLRLALGRRERSHGPEHLALALVTLDPGAAWVLGSAGVDAHALLADLASAFPPPRRNILLRAERRLGRRSRHFDIVRRYRRTTGRAAVAGPAIAPLIAF